MAEHSPDLFEQLWDFLSQILLPNWVDLIAFIPLLFIGLVALFLLGLALMWRRAGARNRSRVPTRLATGSPPSGVHLPGPSKWPFVAPIGMALILFGLILSPVLILIGLAISGLAIAGWLWDAMGEWRATEIGHQGAGGGAAGAAWAVAHGTPRRLGGGAAGGAVAHGSAVATETAAWAIEPPPGVHLPGPSPWPFFAPIAIALVLFGLILSPALIVGGLILALIAVGGWLRDASKEWRATESLGHAVPESRDPQRAWPRRMVPIFATVIALSIGLALLPFGLAWLGSLAPGPAQPTPVVVPARPEIAAFSAVSFDRRQLIVPAGRDFVLVFHNGDVGVPHNVDISDSQARDTIYFEGEIINGDATIEYDVPALDEGDYYFFCRVHPNMNGAVLARPENGSPGGASPGASPGGGSPAP